MARTAVNSSAIHVFDVLRLVAGNDEPLGVSEISRRLGLPGSTVYRALITLEESGYLARHQNMPRYELGHMPQLLNRGLVHRFRLHAVSRPHLRRLAEETGDTSALTVRLGWYGLRLAGVYGSHDIYHRERLGAVAPLSGNFGGLGILAFLSDQERAAFAAFASKHRLEAVREAAIKAARKAGLVRDEFGVALPVRNPAGEPLAAITISGDTFPASDEKKWVAARDALEREIAQAPDSFVSPFAHIAADDILLDILRIESEPA